MADYINIKTRMRKNPELQSNPIRRRINLLTLFYVVIMFALPLSCVIVMEADEHANLPLCIALLSLFALITIVLFALSLVFRKKELKYECACIQEDLARTEPLDGVFKDIYTLEPITFMPEHLYINNAYYGYKNVSLFYTQSHTNLRVLLIAGIYIAQTDTYKFVKINGALLEKLRQLEPKIEGADALDYTINNLEQAALSIFSYGYLKIKTDKRRRA